ncbi:MAG: hypothetical protein ACHP84_03325 [Caulobacterales bacterium]
MRTLILIVALAVSAPAAMPALAAQATPAASAQCIWRTIPAKARSAVLAAGPSLDDLEAAMNAISAATLKSATRRCGVSGPDQGRDVAAAWAAQVLETWSQTKLRARYRVSDAALELAWRHVPELNRAQLMAADQEPGAASGVAALHGMTEELHLSGDEAGSLVAVWGFARLKLAQFGGPA